MSASSNRKCPDPLDPRLRRFTYKRRYAGRPPEKLREYIKYKNILAPDVEEWRRAKRVAAEANIATRVAALAGLVEAAKAGDESAFIEAARRIDWANTVAADYIRSIQLAFEAGAHMAAREISAEGARRYPEDAELRRQAYILSPPRITKGTVTEAHPHRANRDWLKANADEYRGRWVAVRAGELLGTASSVDELIDQVGDTKGVLLTVV